MPDTLDQPTRAILKTKQHFEVLDGLRGVAALAVVTFHFMEMAITDYSKNFIGHGFLAVDFFFCLSGFVIAYAYDDRVQKMGIAEFLKSRLIRLHPLVVFGSILGLFAFLMDPFTGMARNYSPGSVALIFLASIFLIPYPVMQERTYNLFSFNAPAWSLFWEYVANIVYALVLCRISKRALLAVVAVAAAVLCYAGYNHQSVGGGWGGATFWDGAARVAYEFPAGMLVYRFQLSIRTKLGFGSLSVLLLAALMMPYFKYNTLAELLVVLLYFPLLVALGAGATLTPSTHALCVFSGNLSYPLYMTHYVVIWMFMNYYNKFHPDTTHLSIIVSSGVLLLTGFGYLVMRLYDIPVRRYLTARRSAAALARTKA